MIHYLLKFTSLLLLTFLFCLSCIAQSKSKKSAQELFAEVEEGQKMVAGCEQKVREYQIAKFGRVLPRISGDCFSGCPISIVKPYYPREAKRLGISGQVMIETIVDENGKVIYARTIKGLSILSQAAKKAAYLSSYMPKKTCDDKPIKFLWTITYNFVLNR